MSVVQHPVTAVTFPVADVRRGTESLPIEAYETAVAAAVSVGTAARIESSNRDTKRLVTAPRGEFATSHRFLQAVNTAYDGHYPLVLSPDMVWLLIAQGFAQHVRYNVDTLRERLGAPTEKLTLVVIRDEFVRGFAGNDWEGVYTEFAEQIANHVGAKTHDRIVQQFSTTGFVERAAVQVTLMDTMQHFFDYEARTRCGFPEITLEGQAEDWQRLRSAAASLEAYDLEWWIPHLLPVLDQFVAASQGNADRAFWQSFYKVNGGSGGPYIDGYILTFFPYFVPATPTASSLEKLPPFRRPNPGETGGPERNPYLEMLGTPEGTPFGGMRSNNVPPALSVAPFIWKYLGMRYPMEFVAGFVGVAQDEYTLSLRPEIGWAVREKAAG